MRKIQYLVFGIRYFVYNIRHTKYHIPSRGFTLIETLVAISLLTIAIVAPMSLTVQSLSSAYYSRDQITAFNLAQEAIESVRHVRDGNILLNVGTPTDMFNTIPINQPFVVNTLDDTMSLCTTGTCPPLLSDSNFYAYGPAGQTNDIYASTKPQGWATTRFTRTILVNYVNNVDSNGTVLGTSNTDEVRVSATVSWQTAGFQTRTFTISENLYRWVQ